MDMSKIDLCQKYYIFSARDIVNNSFHALEEKRMECLVQYMDMCINTYDDYRTALDPSKLKKSYCGLIEGLRYQLEHHPFRKLGYYRNDFNYLRDLSNGVNNLGDAELLTINRSIVTLKKKIEASDGIESYLECLSSEENFQEIDNLMESLVSDLLYRGYSLNYLSDWFKKQQDEYRTGQSLSVIYNLRELNAKPTKQQVMIKFEVKSNTQTEAAIELIKKQFIVLSSSDSEYHEKMGDGDFYIAQKNYDAVDVRKAVSIAYNEFNAIKELFSMWQGNSTTIKEGRNYYYLEEDKLLSVDVKQLDNIKVLNYIDDYYKKQMERFLTLRDSASSDDLLALERILYTLNTAKSYKNQNRFLNFWSALEYALYSFPRLSIIEKARDVVPASFGLFYIKRKLNIFWKRIMYYMDNRMTDRNYPNTICLITECKENAGEYSTKKLIGIIQDAKRVMDVATELETHVVLYRELAELNMLITKPNEARKCIEDYHEGIKNDLNYIYRLRNQLIHSTNGSDELLEYASMRLYRYVNSILSTILYYKEKNASYTIVEILNSIDATYQEYIDYLKKQGERKMQHNSENEALDGNLSIDDAYHLARPSYMFME